MRAEVELSGLFAGAGLLGMIVLPTALTRFAVPMPTFCKIDGCVGVVFTAGFLGVVVVLLLEANGLSDHAPAGSNGTGDQSDRDQSGR